MRGRAFSQIYRRLKPDEPAYTITGSGGGGTHVYHWDEPRALTNREGQIADLFGQLCLRRFEGKPFCRQIGMACPSCLAKIIVEAILKTFAGVRYSYVEPKWSNGEKENEPELPLLSSRRDLASSAPCTSRTLESSALCWGFFVVRLAVILQGFSGAQSRSRLYP